MQRQGSRHHGGRNYKPQSTNNVNNKSTNSVANRERNLFVALKKKPNEDLAIIRLGDKNVIEDIFESYAKYAQVKGFGPISKCIIDGAYKLPLEVDIDKELLAKEKTEGGAYHMLLAREISTVAKLNTKYDENRIIIFNMIMSQTTNELEDKIKAAEGWNKCSDKEDVVELCNIIRRLLLDQKLGNKIMDAKIAYIDYSNIKQERGETLSDLKRKISKASKLLSYLHAFNKPNDADEALTFIYALNSSYNAYRSHLAINLNNNIKKFGCGSHTCGTVENRINY